MKIGRYTIDKVTKSIGGYSVDYDGSSGCWIPDKQLNGLVPKQGMKITVGTKNDGTVTTIVINGNKVR